MHNSYEITTIAKANYKNYNKLSVHSLSDKNT
jgi:hypothetical protein